MSPLLPLAILGPGRLGRALSTALADAGLSVTGPVRHVSELGDAPVVLACVPERALPEVAGLIRPGTILGHCSASAPLDALAPHERFAMHPLMTVTAEGAHFAGAACAVDGSSDRALDIARTLAARLGMHAIHVPADRRALYHAAASMASNYLVALEASAESLMAQCGVSRAQMAALARAALDNWVASGFAGAITGPIARGDTETAERQRAAVGAQAPQWLPLWDALTYATRAHLSASPHRATPAPRP